MKPATFMLAVGLGAATAFAAGNETATDRAAVDLLADCDAWATWSPRSEIAPHFARDASGGPQAAPVLLIAGGGNPDACGCWRRAMPPLKTGRRYRVEAAFQAQEVAGAGHNIWAILTRGNKEFEELVYRETRDGWHRMSLEVAPDGQWKDLDLRLYLAWSAEGRVRWSDVRLTDITDLPVPRRVVRLAAVSGRPKGPKSISECLDYQICYDNHYPEVARILAVKGAEILVFSNMSDGREGGELWEPVIRTRAVDNQVHIVAAVNQGRSCIVSPRGEILAMTGKEPGAIAMAECDLDASVRNYSGRGIGKRYLQLRRADSFEPLTHHYWESRGFELRPYSP